LPNPVIDSFDQALLGEVQQNNLTPARVLAERVGLSESAVLRRLRRLRAEGVIAADVSVVRPASLGRPVTAIVLVNMVREGRAQIDAFTERLRARPEVVSTWYVTGNADFVLVLSLADLAAYDAFTNEVFLADPNIGKFETLLSLRELVPAPRPQRAPR
jgi:Lrp/AsnC family transcriptional regulator, leucine-responsive regulatory protein